SGCERKSSPRTCVRGARTERLPGTLQISARSAGPHVDARRTAVVGPAAGDRRIGFILTKRARPSPPPALFGVVLRQVILRCPDDWLVGDAERILEVDAIVVF